MRCFTLTALTAAAALLIGFGAGAQAQKKDSDQDKVAKNRKALPDTAPAKPKQPRRVLIFSKTAGFRHDSIPFGIKAISMMGDKTGAYTALASEDESMFEPAKLAKFDAVFMLNTTGDCLRPKIDTTRKDDKGRPNPTKEEKEKASAREDYLKNSLRDFVAGGKGLIGVHSATDTYHNWKDFNVMMGGTFAGHPWHQKCP